MTRGWLLLGPLALALGWWAWRSMFRPDEPDLAVRYRELWAISNDTIRNDLARVDRLRLLRRQDLPRRALGEK